MQALYRTDEACLNLSGDDAVVSGHPAGGSHAAAARPTPYRRSRQFLGGAALAALLAGCSAIVEAPPLRLNVEAIAALEPDLITGFTSGMTIAEYGLLSRVAILTALGFTIPAEIDALTEDGGSYAEISEEQLGLLDQEVLVRETGNPVARAAVEGSAVYRQLGVAEEGRDVFVDEDLLAAAMGYVSVLSLPTVLDLLVPRLAAAIDGDPTTEVSS